jgi:hypothetical protein
VSVVRSIGVSACPALSTYAVRPSGAIAIFSGWLTVIGGRTTFVVVSIGVTAFALVLATYTVRPSGLTAIPSGLPAMAIAGLAMSVAVSIGVTESPALLVTYTVPPSGVTASPPGVVTATGGPSRPETVSSDITLPCELLVTYAI